MAKPSCETKLHETEKLKKIKRLKKKSLNQQKILRILEKPKKQEINLQRLGRTSGLLLGCSCVAMRGLESR